jgi:phosphoribosylformylglycinamidine synthase
MAACGEPGEDAALYATVKAVGMELCPALGVSIPVGKDSLSMRTQWRMRRRGAKVVSPVSLIVTAFATWPTCAARSRRSSTRRGRQHLILIDLGADATAWAAASWRRRWASGCGDAACPTWTTRRT